MSKDDETLTADISRNPVDEEVVALLKEAEMEHILETQEEEDRLISIPFVLQNLKESGHLKSFEMFCELIAKNEFQMQNIGFLLFLDIVDWYSNQSTSEMRCVRQDTQEFWEVGYYIYLRARLSDLCLDQEVQVILCKNKKEEDNALQAIGESTLPFHHCNHCQNKNFSQLCLE